MRSHDLSGYWAVAETYEALKIYMDMDFEGLRTTDAAIRQVKDRKSSRALEEYTG